MTDEAAAALVTAILETAETMMTIGVGAMFLVANYMIWRNIKKAADDF